MTDMTGQVAVITGASRGIGAETARVFAAAGAKVALLARSTAEIEALAREIGPAAMALSCDVSDYTAVAAAFAKVTERFGPIDVLIANAGVISPVARMSEIDPEAWGLAIDINLKGVMWGMRAVLPQMVAQGSGTIITISSGAASNAVEGWSHYCSSKAGAAMLTRMVDKEYGAQGIRAMGLSPGTVATEMQREIKASGVNPVSQLDWSVHIPADWPARALLWMCGPAGEEWCGQEISLRDDEIRRAAGLIP